MILSYVDMIMIAISGALFTFVYMRALEEDMLLEKIGKWLDGPERWKKPLGGCAYCTGFWITAWMTMNFFLIWPLWCILTIIAVSLFLIDLITYHDLLP